MRCTKKAPLWWRLCFVGVLSAYRDGTVAVGSGDFPLQALRQADGFEEIRRIQIISTGLVNHAQQAQLQGRRIGLPLIQLAWFKRRRVPAGVHANDEFL